MNVADLTAKLVALPSFVDEKNDESNFAEYICQYIAENIPWLTVYRQYVTDKRFNIIAYSSATPKTIMISHMDTVLATGKLEQRLKAKVEGDKLFGLGACDMKGGLATSLFAVAQLKKPIPLALVFTCDEEYYFVGIKRFIEEYKLGKLPLDNQVQPEVVIFPEPSDLKIGYGCRGCIELELTLKGRSAHAGRLAAGINAIEKAVELVNILRVNLFQDCVTELGFTSVNLASIEGGVAIDGKIESRANAIADTVKIVLDIRTSSLKQNAEMIVELVGKIAKAINVELGDSKIRLDLAPYMAKVDKLSLLEDAIRKCGLNVVYNENLAFSGYGEFAMVGAELGWNAVNLGPGLGSTSHQIGEYVRISDLEKLSQVYQELFKLLA